MPTVTVLVMQQFAVLVVMAVGAAVACAVLVAVGAVTVETDVEPAVVFAVSLIFVAATGVAVPQIVAAIVIQLLSMQEIGRAHV